MATKNKKTAFYTALAKAPGLLKEYIKQYTQGQVDFPDELVEAFTQAQGDVRKIEQMCNNLKKSKEGAQIMKVAEQVYNAAQQEIDAEVNNSTGLFKDGGKFQYLRKLKGGENVPEENPYKLKRHEFQSDTLNLTPGYRIISQRFYPIYENIHTGEESWSDGSTQRGRVLYDSPSGRKEVYFNYPDDYIRYDHGWMPIGTTKDQESAKKWFYQFIDWADPKNPDVQKVKAEKHGWGGHIRKGMKWLLGKSDDASRTVKNIPTNPRIPKSNTYPSWGPQDLDIDKPFILKRGTDLDIDNVIYKGSPRYEIPTYDLPTFKMSDDVQKLLDDIKSEKIKLTK